MYMFCLLQPAFPPKFYLYQHLAIIFRPYSRQVFTPPPNGPNQYQVSLPPSQALYVINAPFPLAFNEE